MRHGWREQPTASPADKRSISTSAAASSASVSSSFACMARQVKWGASQAVSR